MTLFAGMAAWKPRAGMNFRALRCCQTSMCDAYGQDYGNEIASSLRGSAPGAIRLAAERSRNRRGRHRPPSPGRQAGAGAKWALRSRNGHDRRSGSQSLPTGLFPDYDPGAGHLPDPTSRDTKLPRRGRDHRAERFHRHWQHDRQPWRLTLWWARQPGESGGSDRAWRLEPLIRLQQAWPAYSAGFGTSGVAFPG